MTTEETTDPREGNEDAVGPAGISTATWVERNGGHVTKKCQLCGTENEKLNWPMSICPACGFEFNTLNERGWTDLTTSDSTPRPTEADARRIGTGFQSIKKTRDDLLAPCNECGRKTLRRCDLCGTPNCHSDHCGEVWELHRRFPEHTSDGFEITELPRIGRDIGACKDCARDLQRTANDGSLWDHVTDALRVATTKRGGERQLVPSN